MSPTVSARFVEHYVGQVLRFSKENFVALLLSLVTLGYKKLTGHLSIAAWKKDIWGELFPWAVIICVFLAWYAIKAAYYLIRDVTKENIIIENSGLLLPGGQQHKVERRGDTAPFYRVKAIVMAFILVCALALLPAAVWYASEFRVAAELSPHQVEPPSSQPSASTEKEKKDMTPAHPQARTRIHDAEFKPIEVSRECTTLLLPITIPHGESIELVHVNEDLSKRVRYAIDREISNSGSGPLLWPDFATLQDARNKYGPTEGQAIRCTFLNHSTTDDVINLTAPFKVFYKNNSQQMYSLDVHLKPLDHTKSLAIYFVNDCAFQAQIEVPNQGTAKLAGEQSIREFDFEMGMTEFEGLALAQANVNLTGQGCK